jgi:hypothetical protein
MSTDLRNNNKKNKREDTWNELNIGSMNVNLDDYRRK